jgi:uncharacterized protein (TIGR02145 family)
VFNNNFCENTIGNRKPVIVEVEICKLLDCDAMEDKFAEEDGYREFKYTHTGADWDIVLMPNTVIDSACYYVNTVLLGCGLDITLDGVEFPIGVSVVKVMAYFGDNIDSCEFLVTVERVCPPEIPDEEGNIYNVTKLAGLCWTENLKTTLIPGTGEAITFAKPYTCATCPEGLEDIFGLLYTWHSAVNGGLNGDTVVQGICPEFWHIPSQEEWSLLSAFDAKSLRSKDYWIDPPGPGSDDYGFDARPAGWYNSAINRYDDLYGFTGWWSCDDTQNETVTGSIITYYCNTPELEIKKKTDGLSVRCVMDY